MDAIKQETVIKQETAIKWEIDCDVKILEHPDNSFLKISFKLDPYDDDVIYMGSVVQPFIISDDEDDDDDEFLYISTTGDDDIKVKTEESEKLDIKANIIENWNNVKVNPAINIEDANGNEIKRKTSGSENQLESQKKKKKVKAKFKKKTSTPKDKISQSNSAKQATTIRKKTTANAASANKVTSTLSRPSGKNTKCIPIKKEDNDVIYIGRVIEPFVISDDEDDELLYISTVKNEDNIDTSEESEKPGATDNSGTNAVGGPEINNTDIYIKSETAIEKKKNPSGADNQPEPKDNTTPGHSAQPSSTPRNGSTENAQIRSNNASSRPSGQNSECVSIQREENIPLTSTPSQSQTADTQMTNNNQSNIPAENMECIPVSREENTTLTTSQSSTATAQITNNNASSRSSGQNSECIPIPREENILLSPSQSQTADTQMTNNNQSNIPAENMECTSQSLTATAQITNNNASSRSSGQNLECIPIPKKVNRYVQTTAMFPKNPDFKMYSEKLGYLYKNSKAYFLKYAKDFQTQDEYMFVYRRYDNMMRVFIKSEEEEFFMKSFYDLITCKYAFEYNRRKMLPAFTKYISETFKKRQYGLSHPEYRAPFSVPAKLVSYGRYFIIMATNINDGRSLMIICPTYNTGIFRIYNNYMESFQEIQKVYSTQPNIIAQRSFEFHQLKEGFMHWMSGRQY